MLWFLSTCYLANIICGRRNYNYGLSGSSDSFGRSVLSVRAVPCTRIPTPHPERVCVSACGPVDPQGVCGHSSCLLTSVSSNEAFLQSPVEDGHKHTHTHKAPGLTCIELWVVQLGMSAGSRNRLTHTQTHAQADSHTNTHTLYVNRHMQQANSQSLMQNTHTHTIIAHD